MNATTDPSIKSFIPVDPDSHFPIQNLPFGIFRPKTDGSPRVGTAIGDYVVDLAELEEAGVFDGPKLDGEHVFNSTSLNAFMAMGRKAWKEARLKISQLLRDDEPTIRDNDHLREKVLYRMQDVEMLLPVDIGDYTDFYSSKEHATNVGTIFRGKDNALQPNWLHLPVGYHGRASSIILSGQDIRRPMGQMKPQNEEKPIFGPSKLLDFELEMGFFTGPDNKLGEPIPIDEADDHIFGMILVNDWSARDIQAWEYVPLGPFLAKNFATSISPWIVTLEALEPFKIEGPKQEPEPLPYLRSKGNWNYDINLEVSLKTPKMNTPHIISHSNYKYLYWNICQQLVHHTITGCNIRTGDLMASGTISGSEPDSYGSMLELTWRGTKALKLPNNEERKFLEDGDMVSMTGWCQGDGYKVGFGDVTANILPALEDFG
ncbi:MAG TPA: fumarylacetoacetase [Balneolales bacterium]|nr:fumarylacetoacetase [Balneolales bacterium]